MHGELGKFPDITIHKSEYFAYSDCALFGSYLFGNEVFSRPMYVLSQFVLTEYANIVLFIKLVGSNRSL